MCSCNLWWHLVAFLYGCHISIRCLCFTQINWSRAATLYNSRGWHSHNSLLCPVELYSAQHERPWVAALVTKVTRQALGSWVCAIGRRLTNASRAVVEDIRIRMGHSVWLWGEIYITCQALKEAGERDIRAMLPGRLGFGVWLTSNPRGGWAVANRVHAFTSLRVLWRCVNPLLDREGGFLFHFVVVVFIW